MCGKMSALSRITVMAGLIVGLAGCFSEQSQQRVDGTVSKGPILGAMVTLWRIDAVGRTIDNVPAYTASTDAAGDWSVMLSEEDADELFLVRSAGGSYIDESDPHPDLDKKRRVELGGADVLEGVLLPGASNAVITVQTTALVRAARAETAGMSERLRLFTFEEAIAELRERASLATGFDVFTSKPTDPLAPSGSEEEYRHAMLLGGMAYAMNSAALHLQKPMMDYAVIDGIARDMADCRIDGLGTDGQPVMLTDGNILPDNINLDREIRRFVNNNHHLYAGVEILQIDYEVLCRDWQPEDSDGDGVSDKYEATVGTDPLLLDTDGDYFTDLRELLNDSDPLLGSSTPPVIQIGDGTADVQVDDTMIWSRYGSPYWIRNHVRVSGTLIVEAGVVAKFDPGLALTMQRHGNVIMSGSAAEPIGFSSVHDDALYGDIAADGPLPAAAAGDWSGLYFEPGSTSTAFQHVELRYATDGLQLTDVSLDTNITSLAVRHGSAGAVRIVGNAGPVFESLLVEQVANASGIYVTGNAAPVFMGEGRISGIANGKAAIFLDSDAEVLMSGMSTDGGSYGLRVTGRAGGSFDTCAFRNAAQNGISLVTRGDVAISDSLVADSGWSGLVSNSTGSLQLIGSLILNNGSTITQGGGISLQNTGSGTVIKHNLIRGNSASDGGGLYMGSNISSTASVEIYNNLVLQNQARSAGGGISIYWPAPAGNPGNTASGVHNAVAYNTITENSVATHDKGGGFHLGAQGVVSLHNNMIVGNSDGNGGAETKIAASASLTQGFNALGDDSLGNSAGTNRQVSVLDFAQNWYLQAWSTAIDAAADALAPAYLQEIDATTSVSGQLDGVADVMDIGYHHDGIGQVITGLSPDFVFDVTDVQAPTNTTVNLTIIPRDTTGNVIGAGLDVDVVALDAVDPGQIGAIRDQGDGSYVIEYYTSPAAGSVSLGVFVNGLYKDTGTPVATINISW